MYKKILITIDRSFDAGNRENFILNEILLVVSVFLVFVAGLHLLADAHMIYIMEELDRILRFVEFLFGILFLVELVLRTIYVYIPDKKFFTLFTFMQILVTLSLLMPHVFNLAFLRIIWIMKMFKVYHMQHESHRLVAENPTLAQKP